MRNFHLSYVLIALVTLLSCKEARQEKTVKPVDHPEIEQLFLKDIELRELDARTDTVILENYDKVHRNRIFELLATGEVKTPLDKFRAALILQHTAGKLCDGELGSVSPENYLLAYHLSSTALKELQAANDTASMNKENFPRMVALNYDRFLLYTEGYQKYGTQFVFDAATGASLLAPIDTTLATDKERKKLNVEPLSELLSNHKMKPMPVN
jgi:hypothetical protein